MAGRKRTFAKGFRKANRMGKKFISGEADLQRLIYVIFAVVLAIVLIRGAVSFHSLKAEEKAAQQKYTQLQEQKAELEQDLKYINTPEYIERTARDMLKMVMPGEILYIMRDGTTKTEDQVEQDRKEKEAQEESTDNTGGSGAGNSNKGE